MIAMTAREQADAQAAWLTINSALKSLRSTIERYDYEDEIDLRTAEARLDNWLIENEGRWSK